MNHAKHETLARKVRCSERWLRYLVTKLEELGEVSVAERIMADGRNRYTITNYSGAEARHQHYPQQRGNIKDTERQHALMTERRKYKPKKRRPQ